MMFFYENFSLVKINTLGLAARARFFAAPKTEDELHAVLNTVSVKNLPLMVLGGGSNVVFAQDFPGVVLQPALRGVRCLQELPNHYLVEAAGGEKWHDFVQYCLAQQWYGLENLSLIPGVVGASPIQNIGAYGVEITDCFHSLTALEITTGKLRDFSHAECQFSYRDSVFKTQLRDQFIIVRVRFLLKKNPTPKTDYADIQQELAARGITQPTPQQVAGAVIAVRTRKLPSPDVLGNAGSFFKNPVIGLAQLIELQQKFPAVVAYRQDALGHKNEQGAYAKLAAGWLIEQAGWKGKRMGAAGTYEKQALVLVNHGGATGADIMAVAQSVQAAVQEKFGVGLEIEPRVYGELK